MGSRSYNTVVVLFWVATMSWLFVAKVLPPLRFGDPPSYRSILSNSRSQWHDPPVCWSISLNDVPIGWAASKIVKSEDGMVEMTSYVFLEDLPLKDLAPGWLGAFVRPALSQAGPLSLVATNRMEIDPLNRLVEFESRVRLADIPDAIRMQGQVEGGRLKLKVQSGGIVYRPETVVPESAMVGDELSPLAQLPGLRIGQSWTMPVYSPFRAPNSPMEILQASVERHEPITWSGRLVSTKLVVYRSDAGSGLLSGRESRGKLWVSSEPVEGKDGLVLKQEAKIFNSTLHFVRLPRDRGRALVSGLGKDWSSDLSGRRAKELLLKLGRSDP